MCEIIWRAIHNRGSALVLPMLWLHNQTIGTTMHGRKVWATKTDLVCNQLLPTDRLRSSG